MDLLRRFSPPQLRRPTSFSLVDIGRDTVKVVVLLRTPGVAEPQIVGYGLAETGSYDITGGRLAAAAVTESVNRALTQAEDSTEGVVGQKVVPDDVIFALAGRATIGKLFTLRQLRSRPDDPISPKELKQLRLRTERLVQQGLAQLPLEGGHWRPLAVNEAGLWLDNRLVLEGLGLTGSEMALSLFGIAGQASAWRALEVLAERLDLGIANVVAAWHALAASVPYSEAILLDTGLAGTNVCLIRNDALAAAEWIPFGGSFFTQTIAQTLAVEIKTAKALKHGLASGTIPKDEAEQVLASLESAYLRWYDSVIETLLSLAEPPLPWKIYLTGGGNLLPGLEILLKSDPSPFQRAPEVTRLGRRVPGHLKDLTDGLNYDLFTLALNLTIGLPE